MTWKSHEIPGAEDETLARAEEWKSMVAELSGLRNSWGSRCVSQRARDGMGGSGDFWGDFVRLRKSCRIP